jgi:hypothetical protein
MESTDCFFLYPAFRLVLFPVIDQKWWLLIPVTSLDKMQSDLLDWQKKRIGMCSIVNQSTAMKSDKSEVTISSRLANQITEKRTNWHCLHSGASTDMVMSSWGLERYQSALDLHLSTSGIGRNPRRPHGMHLYLIAEQDGILLTDKNTMSDIYFPLVRWVQLQTTWS